MPDRTPATKRSAGRRRSIAAVVLVAAAAGSAFLVSRTFTTTGTASADRAPGAATTTATAAPATGTYTDPRASGTEPVVTEPPDDIATDEPDQVGEPDVELSYAAWDAGSAAVQVSAYVGGLVEEGGTCTLTLTRAGDSRTASASAFADVSTTICHLLAVPGQDLGSGTWQAVVEYRSGAAAGSSRATDVVVP